MAATGRNQPCPCGSGRKYKKCCLERDAARPGLGQGHLDLVEDPRDGETVVFDFDFDEGLILEVKRLPGRRFDWRKGVWLVPARPGLAGRVRAILAARPWLETSPALGRWLAAERRFLAEVTVVEGEHGGFFAVGPLAGQPPADLQRQALEHGGWLLLALERSGAEVVAQLEGAELDAPARTCLEALRAGRPAPPALLELAEDSEGERHLELRVLWGFSLADSFRALPDAGTAGWREDVTLEVQAQRLRLPADPAAVDQLEELLAAWPALELPPEAAEALEQLRAERRRSEAAVRLSFAEDAELELPGLGGELRPFQRAGVHYALAQRRTFIADEQGLGKTVQALAAIHADEALPAVVVCPASMKLVWEREARVWLPGRSVAVLHGRSPAGWERSGAERAKLVVLNYELLEAHLDRLASRRPAALVFDESQYCKDARRKRTKAAIELSSRAPAQALRLALSGTPILNRPAELPSQLRLLGRLGDFGSGARMSRRFRGERGLERLHWHLRARCYVRRLKADVLPQLPAKEMATVPVELDNERDYRLAEHDVIAWLREQPLELGSLEAKVASALRAEQLVRLGYLRKLAAQGKRSAALDWIEDFGASGEPLVVFAHHRELQEALLERFPTALRLLGSDGARARHAAVDAFQDPGGPQLIVCSLQAASQGITLTRASNVAFLELDWTPARHDQAEDRCHRIGQRSAVTAWYLLAPGTIDETMADVVARKRGVIGAVTDGRASAQESMLGAVVRDLRAKQGEERLAAAA